MLPHSFCSHSAARHSVKGALAKGALARRGSLGSIEYVEKYLAPFDEIEDEDIDISLEDAKKCIRTLAGQQRDLEKMLTGSLKAKQQSHGDAHKLKQRRDSPKTHIRRPLDGTECIVCKKDGVVRDTMFQRCGCVVTCEECAQEIRTQKKKKHQ